MVGLDTGGGRRPAHRSLQPGRASVAQAKGPASCTGGGALRFLHTTAAAPLDGAVWGWSPAGGIAGGGASAVGVVAGAGERRGVGGPADQVADGAGARCS